MADILTLKSYPENYPDDAVKVLNTMTFSAGKDLKIMGSMALRSQQYAGDYDGYEIVKGKSTDELVTAFKKIIKNLQTLPNTYIGDCKAGIIEEWRVLPKGSKKLREGVPKIESLFESKIISAKEAKDAIRMLSKKPTVANSLLAHQELKFHIVRWTPKQILQGHQKLRDGRTYTLEEAFNSPTITKLDVISLVQGKHTEFSVIYEFHINGKVINPDIIDPDKSLKESIIALKAEGDKFKVIKRKFALAKLHNKKKDLMKYHSIINSDLGKLYVVYSDVKTLGELLEQHKLPLSQIREAISGFKQRLSQVYQFDDFLRDEKTLIKSLSEARTSTQFKAIEGKLLGYLSKNTKGAGSSGVAEIVNAGL